MSSMLRIGRDRRRPESAVLEQFAPDGRNLSDTTHPDYDPATDPELRESPSFAEDVQEKRCLLREDGRILPRNFRTRFGSVDGLRGHIRGTRCAVG